MKTVKLGSHTIDVFDAIEDLPIKRYQKFNKMLLIDAGLGSSIEDFMAHASRITAYIQAENKELALKEVRNLVQCVQLIYNGLDTKSAAFAALVYSIDGKVFDSVTDDSILEVQKILSDIESSGLIDEFSNIKKKLETELTTYFPDLFASSEVKEYYNLLKEKAIILSEQFKQKDFGYKAKELEELEAKILTFSDPSTFTGSKSLEIMTERQYQDSCLVLSKELNLVASKCTVLEFYNALMFVRDQQKEMKKKYGKKH